MISFLRLTSQLLSRLGRGSQLGYEGSSRSSAGHSQRVYDSRTSGMGYSRGMEVYNILIILFHRCVHWTDPVVSVQFLQVGQAVVMLGDCTLAMAGIIFLVEKM